MIMSSRLRMRGFGGADSLGCLFFVAGFKPVSLQATTKYVRASRGGTGSFKLGAKYVVCSSCFY